MGWVVMFDEVCCLRVAICDFYTFGWLCTYMLMLVNILATRGQPVRARRAIRPEYPPRLFRLHGPGPAPSVV